MRNISCSHTAPQIVARTKTVTRRRGWEWLKPGMELCVIEKGQGLKKGEKVKRLAKVRVVKVTRERLWDITHDDVALEGFVGMTRNEFVNMFCRNFGGGIDQVVTRIEWEYLDS